MFQFFKGDADELRHFNSYDPTAAAIGTQLDLFEAEAFSAYPLADILMEDNRAPLANAIAPDVFREAFNEIFQSFSEAGTFESYLTVFRKIFGEEVVVTFTVPGPGKLAIAIEATGLMIVDFAARYIANDVYVYDEVVTRDGDNIAFQSFKGLESQYEVEQMLFEMVPGGIFTTITLTVG